MQQDADAMRAKVHGSRKNKTQGVSLSPELLKFAKHRTVIASISFSRYVQSLIELDRQKNLLSQALTLNIGRQKAA
jgi:hypothetical protein